MVPSDNGSVIVGYLRNIRSFSSPRHLRARKFSSTGTPLWTAPVVVYDQFALPIGYFPQILPDGSGGAVFCWHRSDGAFYNGFVQHVDSTGAELLPHEGVTVSTTAGMHHIGRRPRTTAPRDPPTSSGASRTACSRSGDSTRRRSPPRARAPGETGADGDAREPVFKALAHVAADGSDAIAVLPYQPSGTDVLVAWRLNSAGASVWGPSPLVLSNARERQVALPGERRSLRHAQDGGGRTRAPAYRHRRAERTARRALGPSAVPGTVGASLRVARSGPCRAISCSRGAAAAPPAPPTTASTRACSAAWRAMSSDCGDDGGDRTETLTPGSGDRYYLLVAQGSGRRARMGSRPRGSVPCRPCAASPRRT
jgi:hypothetical protein